MWILGCEDPAALGGARLWLRPGSRTVLGRQKSEDVTLVVRDQKSISRAHLAISISVVNEEDGLRLHARTQVTLQDLKTKHGTVVNGTTINGESIVVKGDEHAFSMGKYAAKFSIKWVPIVLSVSLTPKEKKDKNSMLPYRKKMEALDIKTISTWTSNTTHVVASKRNTAIGLQALVNGKYIVSNDYLDAIVSVTSQPASTGGQIPQAPLETDFDAYWPEPQKYLPPKAKEPFDAPVELYSPDSRRQNLFSGWTFVFCEDAQYSSLMGVITDAGGKAEKFKLEHPNTIAPDLADFIRKRGSHETAVVRFTDRAGVPPEWGQSLVVETEQLLGHQMVEQNQFLGVILSRDMSALRRPLEEELAPQTTASPRRTRAPVTKSNPFQEATPSIADTLRTADTQDSQKPLASQAPARRAKIRRRAPVVEPFAFEVDSGLPATSTPTRGQLISQLPDESLALGFSQQLPGHMEIEDVSQPLGAVRMQTQPTQTQKRPPSPELEEVDKFDVMDLMPGSRVVKRRKIEEARERAHRSEETSLAEQIPEGPEDDELGAVGKPAKKGKGKNTSGKKEDAFTVKVREIRQREEEEERRRHEEELAEREGVDVEALRNLAIVETVHVPERHDRPVRATAEDDIRWKPEWNGRKNFKQFRRNGRSGATRSALGSKVLIELVEHKGRDYGIGDSYWVDGLEDQTSQPTRKSDAGDEASLYTTANEQDETPQPLQPRRSAVRPQVTRTQPTARSQATSQASSRPTASVRASTGKRTATTQLGRGGAKRTRALQLRSESESEQDEDSDDDLKFKLRRKRK